MTGTFNMGIGLLVAVATGLAVTQPARAVVLGPPLAIPTQDNEATCSLSSYCLIRSARHVVPFDGVVTSWSTSARVGAFASLVMVRPDGLDQLGRPIGAGDIPSGLRTVPLKVAVRAGDQFGVTYVGRMGLGPIDPGAETVQVSTAAPAAAPTAIDRAPLFQVVLERDADGDGLGDDTQDRCPDDPFVSDPCGTDTPTGVRFAEVEAPAVIPGERFARKIALTLDAPLRSLQVAIEAPTGATAISNGTECANAGLRAAPRRLVCRLNEPLPSVVIDVVVPTATKSMQPIVATTLTGPVASLTVRTPVLSSTSLRPQVSLARRPSPRGWPVVLTCPAVGSRPCTIALRLQSVRPPRALGALNVSVAQGTTRRFVVPVSRRRKQLLRGQVSVIARRTDISGLRLSDTDASSSIRN